MLSPAAHGVWRSLVARFVRDEEVVGSNPATPTIDPSLKPTSWKPHDVGFCFPAAPSTNRRSPLHALEIGRRTLYPEARPR